MKIKFLALLTLALSSGCETIYMQNTVYQYDVVETEDVKDPAWFILLDTGLSSELEINNCFTDHYGGLTPYQNRPNSCEFYEGEGFCCKWTSDSTESYICEEEWCYWEDTCDWDLNGWGEVCALKQVKKTNE
tara:strand:- start:63 stop:458 length:396 start_codon:yes stop_codon:yes gene_type:complete